MNGFILGMVVGAAVVWVIMRNRTKTKVVDINEEASAKKQENIAKIMSLFDSKTEITNNDVQKLLSVSDATVVRYLDELEQQGKIEQIGRTGTSVTYRPKP